MRLINVAPFCFVFDASNSQANVTIPGQEGNMTVYADELSAIADKLLAYANATGAKLLFALTSPM